MGGCATKPKVLKDSNDPKGDAMAPDPSTSPRAPPQEVEDTVVTEAVVENDPKEKEGADPPPPPPPPPPAAVVDPDSATKNSSLGSLFKENQEVKDPAETVKVPDVSEVTTKEVEKTIPEDSSLKKPEEMKREEHAKEAGSEEVAGEIADHKKRNKDKEVDVVTPEEKNLDHIETRIVDSDDKKPQIPRQEEQGNKESDESPKPAVLHPPPAAAASEQENFATPKEKPVEIYAAKDEKKPETEEVKQQTLNK